MFIDMVLCFESIPALLPETMQSRTGPNQNANGERIGWAGLEACLAQFWVESTSRQKSAKFFLEVAPSQPQNLEQTETMQSRMDQAKTLTGERIGWSGLEACLGEFWVVTWEICNMFIC